MNVKKKATMDDLEWRWGVVTVQYQQMEAYSVNIMRQNIKHKGVK